MLLTALLPALGERLRVLPDYQAVALTDLEPLPTTGLAHDHIRIRGHGQLLRVPKQSQLGLDAYDNLRYQASCFERAAASGHTPRLYACLEPDAVLPMGALIVDEIPGQVARLPEHLLSIADALAALHRLPLPSPSMRPPLKAPASAVADTVEEVLRQAEYLDAADLHPDTSRQIRRELSSAKEMVSMPYQPPVTLISFDAHPGNFLVDDAGKAVLVDLEKARYGAPGFDLAHATLYTSTTWDIATHAVLSIEDSAAVYQRWLEQMPSSLGEASRPWLLPLRRIMWLWSVTWCAKWRVQSRGAAKVDKHRQASTEDWSTDLSEQALIRHVAGRVDDYLHPDIVSQVRDDWLNANPLTELLQH